MENKLASQFFAENIGQLFLDFANKKIRSQDDFDFYWHKIFNRGIEIEKKQIIDAHLIGWSDAYDYLQNENFEARQAEDYYNQTYLK